MKNFKIHYIFLQTLLLLGFCQVADAQTTVQVGTSTSTAHLYTPVYAFDTYSASEQLYLGSEINSTGSISTIQFYKTSGANTTAITNVSVYMKTTNATTVGTSTSLAGYTQVWSGTLNNPEAGNWSSITLTTPFAFPSTNDNLSILVLGNNNPFFNQRPSWAYTTTSPNYRASYYSNSSTPWSASSSMTQTYYRNSIKFTLQPLSVCSGTPAPGNTLSTAESVCSGSAFNLSLQNATTGGGVSYQWQSSANGTSNWSNISGANSATVSLSQTAITYYRCNVTCSGNVGTSNSLRVRMSNTIPFFEGFESGYTNGAAVAGCWSQQSLAGSYSWLAGNGNTTYNRAPRTGSWNTSLQYSNEDWLFYPLQLTAGITYELEFYARQDAASGTTIVAAYGTSAASSAMLNTIVAATSVTSGDYQKISGTFMPASSATYYVGIKAALTSAPYYVSVDDIKVTEVPSCSTVTLPTTVSAVASKTSICSAEAITFSLSSAMPTALGITYQWQSSADGTNYVNEGVASATSAASFTASVNKKYFRCNVLCNGSTVLTSTPVQISINVTVTGTTLATRCGKGTAVLGAQTQAGNIIKWYSTADGGIALGTGTTFTTPEIEHTTTYYAAAVGTVNPYNAGAASPANLTSLGGTSNNGEGMKFNVTDALTLTSVSIFPLTSTYDNNVIYLKNASGAVVKSLTFSTSGATLSTTSAVRTPFVVNLNWDIPAGNGYLLEWGVPTNYTANNILRNGAGASTLYNVNNNGITFTGNTGVSNSNNYWFYFYDWKFTTGCGESAVRVPVTATVNYEWTGAQDTNWNNPANWCGGALPTAVDAITVSQTSLKPVVNAGTVAYANTLNVGSGASVNVATGGTLRLTNTLTVADSATVTVEDNGAFVQVNDVANQGKITLRKKANPLYRLDYTLWSSPVAGQNILGFSPQTLANRFYEYKYANNGTSWIEGYWAVDAANASFETGKGYLIRMPNTVQDTPGYETGASYAFTGTFTGTPHNGSVNIPLSMDNNRFTAVGNPYPSPVSVSDFFTANLSKLATDTGIYLWRKRNSSSSSSYATLTRAGLVANPSGNAGSDQQIFYSGIENNWMIAPGQGFIVKTATTAVTAPVLTFTNSMRRNAQGSTQGFFRQGESNASKVWLNVTGAQGDAAQTAIAYLDNTTNDIDYGYDGKLLTDAATISLYSVAVDTKLAIQARPAFNIADVVNLGFSAPNAGQYTISIDHTEGVFATGQKVYLKDNAEGIIRSLDERNYTFTTEAGTFESRFELMYQTNALGTDIVDTDANNVVVYKNDNTLFVDGGYVLLNSVTLYDMQGREVYRLNDVDNTKAEINNLAVQQQVLAVVIDTEKGRVTRKIIF